MFSNLYHFAAYGRFFNCKSRRHGMICISGSCCRLCSAFYAGKEMYELLTVYAKTHTVNLRAVQIVRRIYELLILKHNAGVIALNTYHPIGTYDLYTFRAEIAWFALSLR